MEPCPPPVEVTDFQFKQFSSVRVFPAVNFQTKFSNPSNTISASNKHGLLIVGTQNGFQIINLAQIVAPNASEFVNETEDYPKREYNINAQPSHIALNCDETLLSVAYKHTDNTPLVRIYRMASLTNQSKNKVVKIPVGPPGAYITDFSWNPVIPDLLSVSVSNGCLCLYTHDDTGKKLIMLPPEKEVTCVSWSPKGKQLLAGDRFGHIVQYKPDLKDPQKVVPPPKDLFPGQCSVVNVIWLSVYQYGVVYMNSHSFDTHFSIVNAPKNGPVQYVSYDEICFNSGTVRPHQFYLLHLSAWNILVISSSNSTEVSVLSLLDDKLSWVQCLQEDSTRLDLPIDRNKSETYPVGVTIATCSQLKIKWGENHFLEPMPTLSIVSNDGLVLLFHVINTRPNAAHLCSPATPLPEHMFGTLANPLVSNTNSPQVSAVSTPPASFNIASPAPSQGQSPVIEISTKQNFAAPSPLALLNKPQISITPIAPQVHNTQAPAPVPLFRVQAAAQTQKPDNQFQAMTQSIFQSVIQSNVPETKPQTQSSPVPPTIVKTSMEKQELIVVPSSPETKSIPQHRTGTIKREDLKLFVSLEENINQLLKSYKVNIGSSELDMNLTKINDRVEKLENFYHQLEETTKSLANDITIMKNALNEAFIYAHESKDQLEKYERRKSYDKDPLEGIMISKKSINPIVEKKLISIENEIRKSAYFVRSYIQDSRPILQHLELVKSGKNVLNFQSILQSINKEKAMISRCSLMLDEINRDVLRMFSKHHILQCPKSSQQDRIVVDKRAVPVKPVDKFKSIKDQMKIKPKMSQEKLKTLKNLHTTQVLEPIRHSELNMTNTERLRTSDLLKIFKSSVQKRTTPQKPKEVSEPIPEVRVKQDVIVKQEVDVKPFVSVSTPVVTKTKATVPTALFAQPFSVPSQMTCDKLEITKNTATFVIDTSNTKANATKLTFDDSIAAFSSNMSKNMFTSTPAVTTAAKVPSFAAPTPVAAGFGSTFTKVSEVTSTQPAKPAFQFSIPTSVPAFSDIKSSKPAVSVAQAPPLFSSQKSIFGGVATTLAIQTNSAPVITFGTPTTSAPFSISSASNISSSTIGTASSTPASTIGTTTKPLFPVSISTPTTTASTFNFSLSSNPKLSFGSTATTSTTNFSISSAPAFSTTPSVATTAVVSTPSLNFVAFAKSSSPATTTSSSLSFASTETSKTSTPVKVSQQSVAPADTTCLPKYENVTPISSPTKSAVPEQKTPQKKKTNEKKLEAIASGEHPVSAASSDVTLTSILSPSKSVSSKEKAPSDTIHEASTPVSPPQSESSESSETKPAVTTVAPMSLSFGSTKSVFGGVSKSGGFSFLSAANTNVTPTASSSSSESIASTLSSVGSATSVMFGNARSTPSFFSTTSKVSTTNSFGTPTTSASPFTSAASPFASAASTPPKVSSDAVVPTTPSTPPKPVTSDATVPQATSVEAPSTPQATTVVEAPATPCTPTSSVIPFSVALVTPNTTAPVFSSATSLFGNTTANETTTLTAAFGSPAPKETTPSTADIGNLFGQSLGFGSPSSPNTQASNVFGQSGGNLFSSSSGGTFGQSSGSIFGKSSTPATNVFAQGSVFGQQTPAAGGNVFAKSGSVFGDSKPANPFGTSTSSPFGQNSNASAFGSSPFGAAPTSPFGNAAKTEASSFFGQSTFGNNPTSSPSVFGAPPTSSSSAFGQSSSPFGQSSGFGQSNASTFGSSGGGFGGKSTFGQTGGSIFGGKSTFGQSGGSIFGSGGASPSTGNVFGGNSLFYPFLLHYLISNNSLS